MQNEKETFFDFIQSEKKDFPKAKDFLEKVRKENQQKKESQVFLTLGDSIREVIADLEVIYE